MRREAVDGGVGGEGPDADGAIGAAGDEGGLAHLELADERGVALKNGEAGSIEEEGLDGDEMGERQEMGIYPSCGFHILTLVSRLPVAILCPSKAMA